EPRLLFVHRHVVAAAQQISGGQTGNACAYDRDLLHRSFYGAQREMDQQWRRYRPAVIMFHNSPLMIHFPSPAVKSPNDKQRVEPYPPRRGVERLPPVVARARAAA